MGEKKLILKVQRNKANHQKYVNIPKSEDMEEGDYVMIRRIVDNNKNE